MFYRLTHKKTEILFFILCYIPINRALKQFCKCRVSHWLQFETPTLTLNLDGYKK